MPFTVEQFLKVFVDYNQSVYPAQIVLTIAAIAAVVAAFRNAGRLDVLVSGILGGFWFWMSIAYHFWFFSEINPAAYLFSILFAVQGILFVHAGVVRKRLKFKPEWNLRTLVGGGLIVFSLLLYPIIGYTLGHQYPAAPTFGTPCPTTIFTFGLLLWTESKPSVYLLVVPLVWSVIGFSAAFLLTVREDVTLLAAGLLSAGFLLRDLHPGVRRTVA